MSGVLHPVGPEQPRTYWQRRGLVIVVGLAVLALVVVLVISRLGSGGQQKAVPAAATTQEGPTTRAPGASPSASAQAPAAAPPKTSSSIPTSTTATTTPTKAPDASKEPDVSKEPSPSKEPSKAATTAPTAKAPTPACTPSQLRVTLRGDQSLKVKQKTTFTVSLINGGPTTCVVSVTPSTFELKVYSGTDRIWSTDDCSTAVDPLEKAVDSEDQVEWTLSWNGRRSADDCKNRSEIPLPGTYVATAQLKGADPVQLRMTLRDDPA